FSLIKTRAKVFTQAIASVAALSVECCSAKTPGSRMSCSCSSMRASLLTSNVTQTGTGRLSILGKALTSEPHHGDDCLQNCHIFSIPIYSYSTPDCCNRHWWHSDAVMNVMTDSQGCTRIALAALVSSNLRSAKSSASVLG